MPNLDLFAPATVTLNDVELWIRTVPRFDDTTAHSRVLNYATNYDVVNKIIRAKANNSFYQKQDIDKQNLSRALEPLFKPRFKPCQITSYSEIIRRKKAATKAAIFTNSKKKLTTKLNSRAFDTCV